MKRKKLKALIVLTLASLLLFATIGDVGARKGCCSRHGGVCSYTCEHGGIGYRCCDGTSLSGTCAPYYAFCSDYTSPEVTTNDALSVTMTSGTTMIHRCR
jgi:hypothetical protein